MKRTHRLAVGVFAVAALLGTAPSAHAQRRPARAAQVEHARVPLVNRSRSFAPAQISQHVKNKLGSRVLMVVSRDKASQYKAAMRKDTIEVLFEPRASSYGHLLIRVGGRIYDLPNWSGTRDQAVDSALQWVHSPMYGFTFRVGEQRVASLKADFERFMASRPSFSPTGGNGCYSCASFVTSVLAEKVPELQIHRSISAIGVASSLLRGGRGDAVTIYGSAVNEVGSESFRFEKIE